MPTGKVKFFNLERGYGFIQPDTAGPDLFVHATAITPLGRELRDGEKVHFDVAPDAKTGKQRAVNVSVVSYQCSVSQRSFKPKLAGAKHSSNHRTFSTFELPEIRQSCCVF